MTRGIWPGVALALAGVIYAGIARSTPIPALPELPPSSATAKAYPELIATRAALVSARTALRARTEQHNAKCEKVEEGSADDARCDASYGELSGEIDLHIAASHAFIRTFTIDAMHVLALALPDWDESERDRLDTALNKLGFDGDAEATAARVQTTWKSILARGHGAIFAKEVAAGHGPVLSTAGKQSHEDCAVFALANAAGLPYGVVAARAAKLIGEGEWRGAADRKNPQAVLMNSGLMGGEVIMLAEAFGEVEVVPRSAFADALNEGRPVMVGVVPANGDLNSGHELVLSRTFQHDGQPWYEVMDSNQAGQTRLYASADELSIILKENGVVFRPSPGATVNLLR